jgi:hypothetical protein
MTTSHAHRIRVENYLTCVCCGKQSDLLPLCAGRPQFPPTWQCDLFGRAVCAECSNPMAAEDSP